MTNKKQSNDSTFIYAGDSSLGSSGISRILPKKDNQLLKGLSVSLQNLRNPFPQTLPLKFPKNRIIKGGKSHVLQETTQLVHKPCIRTSQIRNKHNIESQTTKGIRITHQNNLISEDNNIHQIANHSQNSHSSSINSSPQKRSKRIFHYMVVKESMKDPILIGQTNTNYVNVKGKKQFQEEEKKKNFGQGLKSSLQWKVNKTTQRQKFNNRCSAVSQLNLDSFNSSKNRNLAQKTLKEKTKTARGSQKPTTYLEMYNSRRIGWK